MEAVKEKESKLMGIDIGCGDNRANVDGYFMVGLDIRGEVRPDIIAPVDAIPVPDSNFDLVFASHVLEHVKRADIQKTLKEWRRILKVGGKLQLIVPDLEIAAIELLSCSTTSDTFDILWGAENHDRNHHYCGFTHQMLKAQIEKFGFTTNYLECKQRCIYLTATKLEGEYL